VGVRRAVGAPWPTSVNSQLHDHSLLSTVRARITVPPPLLNACPPPLCSVPGPHTADICAVFFDKTRLTTSRATADMITKLILSSWPLFVVFLLFRPCAVNRSNYITIDPSLHRGGCYRYDVQDEESDIDRASTDRSRRTAPRSVSRSTCCKPSRTLIVISLRPPNRTTSTSLTTCAMSK